VSRRPLVAANWKMHHLAADARAFCARLTAGGKPYAAGAEPEVECVIFPGFPLLPVVAAGLDGGAAALGGQDLHPADAGAHTGDVSAAQLADAGCAWALAGHSERRHDHGEDDGLVAAKIAAAVRHGLKPMLCLGETGDERRAGRTLEVLDRQLAAALEALPEDPGRFAVAYEPVWAIGTGDTATPETAQEAHAHLRRRVGELRGAAAARELRILYGGSVKPANAGELIRRPDLDGFLVGGASLDAGSFLAIIAACA
jgi:triosephosphate isomerase (TIM)